MSSENFVPEIKILEEIPIETEEGFILETLRTVEDIENRSVDKDVYTNKNIPSLVSDCFENLRKYMDERGNVLVFPKDEIIQIALYVEKVVKKILNNPKFKIEKVESMLHFSRVRNLDSKSMIWLSKQPGRTLREKIGTKEKIRTKISRYSYQTKENAAVVALLDIILPILRKRIEKNETKFKEGLDAEYHNLCKHYLDIKRRYRNSDLYEVVGKFDNNPNNTLINDRNYSVIYRGYRQLKHYNEKIKKDWKSYQKRFVWSIFMGVAAELEKMQELYLGNEVYNLEDKDGDIGIVDSNGNSLSEITFYLPDEAPEENTPVKAIVCFKKEGKFLLLECPEKNISKIVLNQNMMKKEEFDNIKLGDILYIEYKNGEKGYYTTKIAEPQERKISKLVLNFNENIINVRFCEKTLEFGIKFNKKNEKYYTNLFLDKKKIGRNSYDCNSIGYSAMVKSVVEKIKSKLELKLTEVEENSYIQQENNGMGMDFTSYTPVIYDGKIREDELACKLKVVKCKWKETDRYFDYNPNYNYNDINELIPMNEVFYGEKESHLAFQKSVDRLISESGLNSKDYFTFLVPDNLDEFEQKPLKTSIGTRYSNSFPVWRSVAGAISVYKETKFLTVEDSIMVVDLNAAPICVTHLRLIEKDDGEKIFEHYPCFQETLDTDFISYKSFIELYLEQITLGMNLSENEKNNIIKSGVVDRVITSGKDELYFTGERFIDIIYNEILYKSFIKKGMVELNDLIKTFEKKYFSKQKVKILILGSHLNNSIKQEIGSGKFVVRDDRIAAGAYEIAQRLNRGKDTWNEYLPNLSLEIIKNGCYGEFPLTNNKHITAMHSVKSVWEIEGNLILPRGKKDYKFPLLKQETENKTTLYEAKIESDAFPLKEDLPVKLKIEYTYGMGNNYTLKVYPDVKDKKPFDEIEVKWESLESNIKFNKIEIPPVELSDRRGKNLLRDFESLCIQFVNFFDYDDEYAINPILSFMKKKKNIVRQARMKYRTGENSSWNTYVIKLKDYAYKLYEIFDREDPELRNEIRRDYDDSITEIEDIRKRKLEKDVITLFLCALGEWDDVNILKNSKNLSSNDIICLGHLLSASYDKDLALKLLLPLTERNKVDKNIGEIRQNWQKRIVIQALSGLIKYNDEFLPNVITEKINKLKVSQLLIRSLKEQFSTIVDNIEKKRYQAPWEVIEP